MKNLISKFVIFYDDHYPDNLFAKILNLFLKDERPDILIFGGDTWGCEPVSHWGEEQRFKQLGLNTIRKQLMMQSFGLHNLIKQRITSSRAKKVYYIIGNHEDWIRQYEEKYGNAGPAITLDSLLHLSELGIEIIPRGGYIELGKILVMHGDTLRSTSTHAKLNVQEWQQTMLYGHLHTEASYTNVTPLKQDLPQQAHSIGGLTTRDAHYNKRKANKTMHQFVMGYIHVPTGFVNYYPITILNGQFVSPKGKLYK